MRYRKKSETHMYDLSEQAQKLIEDFEKRIETVPADERNAVLKRMTSHISALNEDAENLLKRLRSTDTGNDVDHVSEFL